MKLKFAIFKKQYQFQVKTLQLPSYPFFSFFFCLRQKQAPIVYLPNIKCQNSIVTTNKVVNIYASVLHILHVLRYLKLFFP